MEQYSSKLDNQLNLAVNLSEEERSETLDLNAGYIESESAWELIVRYAGSLDRVAAELQAEVTELSGGYGIIVIEEDRIPELVRYPEIIYIDKPNTLLYEDSAALTASCIYPAEQYEVNQAGSGLGGTPGGDGTIGVDISDSFGGEGTSDNNASSVLSGRGTIVAIIDSGIDYRHPDFRNDDGTTRIVALWDQTISGGIYTSEEINRALEEGVLSENVPSFDGSGHGTAVAGIACGNGRASGGRNRGVAYESDIIVVKLGSLRSTSSPMTAELMSALDFCIRTATERGQPLAVNISFGNSYGSHNGTSLLENYINDVSKLWKTVICIGTGNEGASGRHISGRLRTGTYPAFTGIGSSLLSPGTSILSSGTSILSYSDIVEFTVAEFTPSLNLQLWRSYSDDFELVLVSPSGAGLYIPGGGVLSREEDAGSSFSNRAVRLSSGNTRIIVLAGEPQPFSSETETYFEFIPRTSYMDSGIWKLYIIPVRIRDGYYSMYLPAGGQVSEQTRFLYPVTDRTYTIPSTAASAISVGAYNSATNSAAPFSGRGNECICRNRGVKPELAAPGVDITTTIPGGGYAARTGTSFATPFVTGSCSLLMQYGIVMGNDQYLYGEKVKAYLVRGARQIPALVEYPNPQIGWGALCVRDSLPS